MAKNRKDNIDSFSGMFQGTETPPQEQLKGQESLETLEGGKYMPSTETPQEKPAEPPQAKEKPKAVEPAQTEKKKKAGRPKLENREKRARYSFTILPSVYEKAQEKATQEGKTLSELIADFLTDYAE